MAALPPREETGEIPQESEAAAPINVEGERKAAKGGSKDAKGGQGPGKGGDKGGGGGKKKKGKR